jgi:hypothetical protein
MCQPRNTTPSSCARAWAAVALTASTSAPTVSIAQRSMAQHSILNVAGACYGAWQMAHVSFQLLETMRADLVAGCAVSVRYSPAAAATILVVAAAC